MKKPPIIKHKRRFSVMSTPLPVGEEMRPNLASGDYCVNAVHDGSAEAISQRQDYFFGRGEEYSKRRTWWFIEIQLTYNGPNPENVEDGMVHYLFRALPPNSLDFPALKLFTTRILEELYQTLGRGKGKVYFSTIPANKVQEYLDDERIIKFHHDSDTLPDFKDWTVTFFGDSLHTHKAVGS